MSRMDRAARILAERRKAETEAAAEKSDNRRQTRRGVRSDPTQTTPTTTPATTTKNYNVGVSKGGVPFAESFKYHRDKGQKTFTWNGKRYTTDLKDEVKPGAGTTGTGKADDKKKKKRRGFLSGLFKKSDKEKSDIRNRSRRRLMRKAGGGMMTKKGYAKGGMTKKGYAKGGSVRGKPRGVGAALRGYGKALK